MYRSHILPLSYKFVNNRKLEVNFKMELGNIQTECTIYKLTFFVKSTQTY